MRTLEEIADDIVRGRKACATPLDCELVRAGMAEAYRRELDEHLSCGHGKADCLECDRLKRRAEECGGGK